MNLDKLLNINFTWDNRRSILYQLSKPICVKFAIFFAEQALPLFESKYPDDNRPRKAIESAKTWLADPSEENRAATYAAANAAYAAAYAAANAAHAAYAAAYAARAAYAAADATARAAYAADAAAAAAAYAVYTAAAYAADANAAARAAHAAAYAAYAADPESLKQEQMDYLRQLIIDSLTEEQKEDWLLVASL